MAVIKRFSTTIQGALYQVGNSLGLYSSTTGVGNLTTATPAPPSGGTTTTYTLDSNAVNVQIPVTASVVYAELSYQGPSSTPVQSLPSFATINNSIFIKDPKGVTTTVPVDPTTTQLNGTFGPGQFSLYTQSMNITNVIKNGGNGFYTLSQIPVVIGGSGSGFTIMIAYEDSTLPFRNITIWSSFEFPPLNGTITVPLSGFSTPSSGTVSGRLAIGAASGNSEQTGDYLKFGATAVTAVTLSGPNNPINNFFSSQINNNVGTLDTTGTWGNANATPGSVPPNGARTWYDTTNVDASPGLTNNQTTAQVILGTTGDYYAANIIGLQVDVNSARLAPITKTSSSYFADINDTITYTISFVNAGLVSANNTTLIDTIPAGLQFVAGTVKINGVTQGGYNPNPPGFNMGDIGPGARTTITFDVKAVTIPSPNPTLNQASIAYQFVSAPGLDTISASDDSSIVGTKINHVDLSNTKSVNKAYANVGDTLTYTVLLKNIGNTTATNITFIDTIPTGTSLVPGSFTQNGTPVAGSPNPPGVSLPTNIPAGSTSTVVFSVTVNTIPNPNPIPNTATASFSYIIDPTTSRSAASSIGSSTVTTQVNNANLDNVVKGVDKQYAKIGDVLTYTITIPNRGSTTATNVIFKDTIPSGTSFVANSVILNGVQQTGLVVAPPTGLSIGSIAPNGVATLSFQVTVTTIPSPNPIPNSGKVEYSYVVDPVAGTSATGSNNTNIVSTTINSAVINSTKTVTPTNTTVGETLFYTIVLTNTGNTTANNVTFIDTIPNDTTFEVGSVAINGTPQPTFNPAPPNGFAVSNIAPNGRTTITFRVSVNTIPNPNPIPNSSTTNYNFVVNPTTGETAPNSSLSNTVSTFVSPDSNPLKIADKQYAKPGDIITYTVQWENRLSVTATDVTFIDTIPNDTSFIPNSFTINGVTVSGASPAPPTGVNVGTVPAGAFTTVTFKVLVNTIPNPNPIPNQAFGRYTYVSDTILGTVTTETATSNIVTTQINYASIPSATKAVNRAFAKVGDILTYTITFTNIGNTTATNIKLIDTIPNGTSFNINSVFLNGVNQPGAVVAPPTGLSVGSLAVNATATVVFTVTVDTVPSPNPIPNTANVGYDYIIDPVVNTKDTGGVNTNTANTQVNYANLGIIGKTVDKTFANTSDTLLYTITIRNTGNVTANNLILADTIPNDTSFINGSVLVNGVSTATVPTGNVLRVNIGTLAPNGVASLTFRVQITGAPNPNPIPNSATANYTYTIDPASPNGQSASNNTNIVNTQVNAASLGGITKFVDKTFATCGDIITYTISIPNTGNITANNVILSDTVPNGTVFVANSILVNGVSSSATSPTSVPIGTINPGATTTVSFKVQVVC